MALKKYGTTWWGRRWLDALEGIDYANRIPRGLSYARNERVFNVIVNRDKGTIVAHVVGKYNPYYTVVLTFPRVDEEKKKAFLDAAAQDLSVVSRLTSRELDPKLCDIAQQQGIRLFPRTWHDIGMVCDCPDDAVPCKHIAAVIYEVSELIDTDPFCLFELIGIDIISELEKRNIFNNEAANSESVSSHKLYLDALMLPEQLMKDINQTEVEVTLTAINPVDAKQLFRNKNLLVYKDEEVIFSDSLRLDITRESYLKKKISDLELHCEQAKISLDVLIGDNSAKKVELDELKSNFASLKTSRGRPSARVRALESLLEDTQKDIEKRESAIANKRRVIEEYQEQILDCKKELNELHDTIQRDLRAYHDDVRVILSNGYDSSIVDELPQFEDAKVVTVDDEDEDESDASSYDTNDATSLKAIEIDESNDDLEAITYPGEEIRVCRYYGNGLSELERLSYEDISDLTEPLLGLYEPNANGFTRGNLRDHLRMAMSHAAKLATEQMQDTSDQQIFVFDERLYANNFAKAREEGETKRTRGRVSSLSDDKKIFNAFTEGRACSPSFSRKPFTNQGYFSKRPLLYLAADGNLVANIPMAVLKSTNLGTKTNPEWETNLFAISDNVKDLSGYMDALVAQGGFDRLKEYKVRSASLCQLFSGFFSNAIELSKLGTGLSLLYYIWLIASRLVEKGAIIPQLYLNYEGKVQCRWMPATCYNQLYDYVHSVGAALLGYEHYLFNRLDRSYYLDPVYLGQMVLSAFIQSYMETANINHVSSVDADELRVLFTGDSVDPKSPVISQKSIAIRLEGYLSFLRTTEIDCIPVLRFIDLSYPDSYRGTVFEELKDDILKVAKDSAQEQKKMMLSYAEANDDYSFIDRDGNFMGEDDGQEYYEDEYDDEYLDYDNVFGDCGAIGMELGFLGFDYDSKENLEHHLIDETGFVSLCSIVKNDAFEAVRQDCFRTLSRLASLAPSLETLYSSKNNVAIIPLNELHQVLAETQSKLNLLGVRLVLPKSMSKLITPRATVMMDVEQMVAGSFMDLQSMLDFNWTLAVGDHSLSNIEFKMLLANAGNIVRFKDKFIYADPDLLKNLQRKFKDGVNKKDVTPAKLLSGLLTGSLDGSEIVFSERLKENLDKLLSVQNFELPAGLKATLRPYQMRGYEWLMRNSRIRIGSIIADDMGLGKTVQVIATLLKLKEEGALSCDRPALIVVPTSLITNWMREVAQFAPDLSVGVYYGSSKELPYGCCDLILTSYGTARSRIKTINAKEYSVLVSDESQAIKNMQTAITKAMRTIVADNVIAMSGTPVENHLIEYYSVLDFTNRGLFGTASKFNSEFAYPIEVGRDADALERFKMLTKPFIMRRLKSDKSIINDLPAKISTDQYCDLTKTQAALYQAVLDQKMRILEDETMDRSARRAIILGMIQNLKAICNSPAQFDAEQGFDPSDSGKVQRLMDLLDSLMEDRTNKILIFTQSVIMGRILQNLLGAKYKRPDFFYGGLSRNERTSMVDNFQNDVSERILLLSLRAAGTGLNLTAANTVIHFDLWWNPAVENQATDRAYRIGQKNKVNVYRFICANTFEERINDMIESKRDLADRAVTEGENWIGDMSNSQLNDLFALHETEE